MSSMNRNPNAERGNMRKGRAKRRRARQRGAAEMRAAIRSYAETYLLDLQFEERKPAVASAGEWALMWRPR